MSDLINKVYLKIDYAVIYRGIYEIPKLGQETKVKQNESL